MKYTYKKQLNGKIHSPFKTESVTSQIIFKKNKFIMTPKSYSIFYLMLTKIWGKHRMGYEPKN